MYKAYYLERSDGDGDLCAVVNFTDIDEDLSNALQSQIVKVIGENGEVYRAVESSECDFPDVWEFIEEEE